MLMVYSDQIQSKALACEYFIEEKFNNEMLIEMSDQSYSRYKA